jgi:hypothetical protein
MDFHENKGKLQNRAGIEIPCDVENLRNLAERSAGLAGWLDKQCGELIELLGIVQEPTSANESLVKAEEDDESDDLI